MTLTLHPPLVCLPTGQVFLQYGPEKVDDFDDVYNCNDDDDYYDGPVKSLFLVIGPFM